MKGINYRHESLYRHCCCSNETITFLVWICNTFKQEGNQLKLWKAYQLLTQWVPGPAVDNLHCVSLEYAVPCLSLWLDFISLVSCYNVQYWSDKWPQWPKFTLRELFYGKQEMWHYFMLWKVSVNCYCFWHRSLAYITLNSANLTVSPSFSIVMAYTYNVRNINYFRWMWSCNVFVSNQCKLHLTAFFIACVV